MENLILRALYFEKGVNNLYNIKNFFLKIEKLIKIVSSGPEIS